MRMTLAFMLVVGVILVAVVLTLSGIADRIVDRQVRNMAGRVNRDVMEAMGRPGWQDKLGQIARQPNLVDRGILLAVIDPRSGTRIYQSSPNFPRRGDRDRNFRMVPGGPPGHRDPFFVLLAIPSKQLDEFEAQRRTQFIGLVTVVLVLITVGSYMLVGKTLSPIGQLSKQASEASVDHLDIELTPPSEDQEIVELVDTLNGLLHRIAQTTAAKGRFYSAASHELRTPLQALSGHLELALTRKRSPEEYETFLAEAHTQAVRLIDLTRNLLLLHQLDTTAPRAKEPVDLLSVCIGALTSLEDRIALRMLKIVWGSQEDAEVLAIHSHAEILIRNVVENAVKYADEGSTVRMALTRADGRVVLSVVNACATAGELSGDKVFEAFYRPDASRNSKTGGNGLGLAICKAVASANGWTIQLIPSQNSVTVEASFPVAEIPARSADGSEVAAS